MVLAVLGGLLTYMYWPAGPVEIIISRETTYILGPLNPDGTPNYFKYVDDKYAEGVTPENNAARLVLQAFGPEMLAAEVRAETLARLDIPPEIFDGNDYFVEWENRPGQELPDPNDSEEEEDWEDYQSRAVAQPLYLDDVYEMLLAGEVHPDLEAWLASNAGPLDLLRQAGQKGKLYFPLISTSTRPTLMDARVPTWSGYSHAAEALATRALLKAARNDLQGAWEDVLTAHKLAILLDRSPYTVERLIGSSADENAAQLGITITTRYPTSPAHGRKLLGRLASLQPRGSIVEAIDRGERLARLEIVMTVRRLAQGKGAGIQGVYVTNGTDLDWNQMLREVTTWQNRTIDPLRLPRFRGREEAQKAVDEKWQAFADGLKSNRPGTVRKLLYAYGGRPFRAARTDLVTKSVIPMAAPSLNAALVLEDRAKMTCEIETIAVALACFHAENGRWPGELKELCPSLLKAIPADRFSVKPLVYRPTEKGYLLYSVGMNLTDDGGKEDDIVAEVKPVGKNSK